MKKNFYFLCYLFGGACFFNLALNAQLRILKKPPEFVYPYENIVPLQYSNVSKGKAWIVFSNNHNEPTYKDASLKEVEARLGFMETYYVIAEEGNTVEIAKGDLSGFELKQAESYGWIHKDNLLLWNDCQMSKENRTKKVLLFDKASKAKSIILSKHVDSLEDTVFVLSPESMSLFYLYKVEQGRAFIGNSENIDKEKNANLLFGWTDKDNLIAWDNGISFESNWNLKAANERREKNNALPVFNSLESAKAYQKGWSIDSIGQNNVVDFIEDKFERRASGYHWRALILEEFEEEGIAKVVIPISVSVPQSSKKIKIKKKHLKKKKAIEAPKPIEKKEMRPLKEVLIGYITWEATHLKTPLFKPVVFLSIKELGDLLVQFGNLKYALQESNGFEMRNVLYQRWLETVTQYSDEPIEVIEKWSMEKINQMVYGVSNKGSVIAQYKLKDLKDENVVKEEVLESYVYSVERKIKELQKIYNNPYHEILFDLNNVTYYWLSESLLP